jgi:hypothetical protein
MAGSFGVNVEHYQLSMAVGESKILPLVRNAPTSAYVVINRFSCREQIEHGTGRRSIHIAQLALQTLTAAGRGHMYLIGRQSQEVSLKTRTTGMNFPASVVRSTTWRKLLVIASCRTVETRQEQTSCWH